MKPMDAPGRQGLRWECRSFDELGTRRLHDVVLLRHAVFIVEQRCCYGDFDGIDPQCRHVLALDAQGGLAAYARIVPPGLKFDAPSIGRVVVAQRLRRSGIGRTLMTIALREARKAYPGQPIRISAQAHLAGYYGQFGFLALSDAFDDEGIPHIDMLLEPSA